MNMKEILIVTGITITILIISFFVVGFIMDKIYPAAREDKRYPR